MRRGTYLEDGIARWYAARFGLDASGLVEVGTVRHTDVAVALCTPDRIVEPEQRLLSIKAPRRGGDAWGPDGSSQVPSEYLLQLQWEHAVCTSHGALSDEMHLAALVDGDLRVYVTQADLELQRWLLDYATEWWARHVARGEQPPLDGSSEASAWLRSRFPRDAAPVRQATPWEDLRMLALRGAEAEAERWNGEVETLKSELKQAIGDASGLESPAGRVTWKTDKRGRRTFKTKWETP
jgi:predicted phage-related endonuclease